MLHFGRAARKFCILMLSLYLIVVCSMCVHNRQVSRRHFKTSSVTEQYNYFGRAYIVYGFFFIRSRQVLLLLERGCERWGGSEEMEIQDSTFVFVIYLL